MDKQAKEARKMAKELPFKDKVNHIWTYYKWWFISFCIAAILIGFSIYQAVTKPSYDLEIAMYTDEFVDETTIASLEEYISQFVEDIDGDGEKTVHIIASSTGGMTDNLEYQSGIQMKFVAELSADMYYPYILEGHLYDIAQQEGYVEAFDGFTPLSENGEIKQIMGNTDTGKFYWSTRILYDRDKDKEDSVIKHSAAKDLENKIFN